MKKLVSIIIILFIGHFCFGQAEEENEIALTYSVGLAYNQIWLQSNLYGTEEYGVSSSLFNWGITPYFTVAKGRLVLYSGINYSSCSRKQEYYSNVTSNSIVQDKW